jgi:biopolymer transport protein ExbD
MRSTLPLVFFFGINLSTAAEPAIESLSLKVKALEQRVADLEGQVADLKDEHQTTSNSEFAIAVLKEGSIRVGGEAITDAELKKLLRATSVGVSELPLRISAHKEAKVKDILRVIEMCKDSGVTKIIFPTEKQTTNKPALDNP